MDTEDDNKEEVTKILNDILESFDSMEIRTSDHAKQNTSPQEECKSVNLNSKINCKIQTNNSNNNESNEYKNEMKKNNIDNSPMEKITVKEIINEILDCTVLRKPHSISQKYEGNFTEPSTSELDEEFNLESFQMSKERISLPKIGAHSQSQLSVKEIINEILDYTIFNTNRKSNSTNFQQGGCTSETSMASCSQCQQGPDELGTNLTRFQIYRAKNPPILNSTNIRYEEIYLHKPISKKSTNKLLPSYSTVLKLGPPQMQSFLSTLSFIPKLPPPSYAEVEGLLEDNPSTFSSETMIFGPDPTYIVCPRCRIVVITDTSTQRSNMTHLIAFIMCLCMCWPCCLLPYCLKSCNYTYHTCPNCRHYFGMYRPF